MVGARTPGQDAAQYLFFVHLLSLSTSVAHQAFESPSMVVQVVCERPAVERKGKMQSGQSFLLADVELSTNSPKRSTKGVYLARWRKGKMHFGQSFLLVDVELSTRSPKRSTKGVDPSLRGEGINTDTRQAGMDTIRRRRCRGGGILNSCTGCGGGRGEDISGPPAGKTCLEGKTYWGNKSAHISVFKIVGKCQSHGPNRTK